MTLEHRAKLDSLLQSEAGRRGTTRLSWLREPPGLTSPKSVRQIVERWLFLKELGLPALSTEVHQNWILQLARRCSKYQAQPLMKFKTDRRHALLVAHLFPQPHFDQLVQKQQTRLAVANEADAYLAAKQQEIRDRLRALWEHVNLIGHYHFAPQTGRSLDNLRPLRKDLSNEEAPATSSVAD